MRPPQPDSRTEHWPWLVPRPRPSRQSGSLARRGRCFHQVSCRARRGGTRPRCDLLADSRDVSESAVLPSRRKWLRRWREPNASSVTMTTLPMSTVKVLPELFSALGLPTAAPAGEARHLPPLLPHPQRRLRLLSKHPSWDAGEAMHDAGDAQDQVQQSHARQ